MAQIFHRSFNVVSKVSIFGALFFAGALGWVAAVTVRSPHVSNAYLAIDQPVPFSHEHHVGQLGIDCRYCHQTVEQSSFAGMPSTKTCMNCHSIIWAGSPVLAPVRDSYRDNRSIEWQRVHRLADFVYFDHSIHVKKGIGCVSCHGRVDQMPLTWQVHTLYMDWCLDCHRNPEKHVRPRAEVFNLAWEAPADAAGLADLAERLGIPKPGNREELGRTLVKEYRVESKTSCSVCHR